MRTDMLTVDFVVATVDERTSSSIELYALPNSKPRQTEGLVFSSLDTISTGSPFL